VRRTVPPSAEIEAQIDRLLAVGVGENPRELRQAGSDGHLEAGFCPGREEGFATYGCPEEVQRRVA
jgi:hypothetical protein